MKLKKLILAIILLSLPLFVHAQERSSMNIIARDVFRYNNYLRESIKTKVIKAIKDKGIIAYQDSTLTQKLDMDKLAKEMKFCEVVKIPRDPNFPNVLTDSFICIPIDMQTFYFVTLNNLKLKPSIYFYYPDSGHKAGYYVSFDEVKKSITKQEQVFLDYLFDTGKKYHYNLDSTGMRLLSDSILLRIGTPIYNAALSGKLPAYPTDSLSNAVDLQNHAIALNKLKEIGVNYYPAPNGLKKKGTKNEVDSLLPQDFKTKDIKGITIVNESGMDAYATTFRTVAIGPYYSPFIDKVRLPSQVMFYVEWDKRAISLLTERDQEYLKGLINFYKLWKICPRQYGDMYDFWRGEVGE